MQTHTLDTRKPAFRWLGFGDNTDRTGKDSAANESRKRVFGMDVTNMNFKRSKVDSSIDGSLNINFNKQKQMKHETFTHEVDNVVLDEDSKDSAKSYHFGPFAPVTVARGGASNNNNPRRVHDWENLASTHRPQYQNQGIEFTP